MIFILPKFLKRPVGLPLIHLSKNMSTFRINCLAHGDTTERIFPVDIPKKMTVSDLKEKIQIKKKPDFDQFTADKLDLWKVNIPLHPPGDPILNVLKDDPMADIERALKGVKLTNPLYDIGECWQEPPPKHNIHVIVKPSCK